MSKIMKVFLPVIIYSAGLLVSGQVKITDGSDYSLDANSLLELESSSKGVLVPRMAINDLNLPAPLTAPVPEGMLVYSTGGTVADGFYFWNGSQWKKLAQATIQVNEGGTGQTTYSDGELLIGNSGGLSKATLNGTPNRISITNSAGGITISAPQDIHSEASPTFNQLTLNNLSATAPVYTDASKLLTTTAPATGNIGFWNRTGTILSPLNSGDAVTTSGNLSTTGTGTITSAGLLTGSSGLTVANAPVSLNVNSNFTTNINTGTSSGAVTIGGASNSIYFPRFSTAGILHNDASGLLSSGLIVNSDIANGTINLSTKVTDVLPVANGGTGLSAGTSGGIPAFTGGTTITSSGLLTQNAVMIGGGAGATPSTISTGTAGQILTSNGTAAPTWEEGDRYVRMTSAVTTSSTSFTDATGLSFTPEANKDYLIEFRVIYSTNTTGKGIYLAVNGPSGITGMAFMTIAFTNATTIAGRTFNAYNTGGLIGSAITGYNHAIVSGILRNGNNSGTFVLRFASEGGGGATATIEPGSILKYRKLN